MPYKRKVHVMPKADQTFTQPSTLIPENFTPAKEPDKMSAFLSELAENDRSTIQTETREFLTARAESLFNYLQCGRHLLTIHSILEPKGKFVEYLRLIPNISTASAYRNIWSWQNGQKLLPPATLAVAAAEGIKLISRERNGGFAPGFAQAVSAVTDRLGPAPHDDAEKAHVWLDAVREEKRKLSRGRHRTIDAQPDIKALHTELLKHFRKVLNRIPDTERKAFATKSIGLLVSAADVPVYKVKPQETEPYLKAA